MFGTSLGVNLETGRSIEGRHHHLMRAINAARPGWIERWTREIK